MLNEVQIGAKGLVSSGHRSTQSVVVATERLFFNCRERKEGSPTSLNTGLQQVAALKAQGGDATITLRLWGKRQNIRASSARHSGNMHGYFCLLSLFSRPSLAASTARNDI